MQFKEITRARVRAREAFCIGFNLLLRATSLSSELKRMSVVDSELNADVYVRVQALCRVCVYI